MASRAMGPFSWAAGTSIAFIAARADVFLEAGTRSNFMGHYAEALGASSSVKGVNSCAIATGGIITVRS